ncbi:hypothetical protein CDEST_13212 [Colletotrichum destructivum]|uniref:Uncharacterized protein n=1 Tax=Colletotrichum destructivum TaxID=34406 RepID=A0AAX4IY35_9PEZI|nr:hypothetical protein CDEST_13212 [Colletotrichum destructivum]
MNTYAILWRDSTLYCLRPAFDLMPAGLCRPLEAFRCRGYQSQLEIAMEACAGLRCTRTRRSV